MAIRFALANICRDFNTMAQIILERKKLNNIMCDFFFSFCDQMFSSHIENSTGDFLLYF